MEGGKNTNYWPGFVDALGNTIIAMVFVVIVLAISLSMYVKLLAQRQAERIVAQKLAQMQVKDAAAAGSAPGVQSQNPPPAPAPRQVRADSGGQLARKEVVETRAPQGDQEGGVPELREQSGVIEVIYGSDTFELEGAARERLRELVRKVRQATGNTAAEITLLSPQMQFTEVQRHAYLRAMILRNELIDMGYPPRLLTVRSRVAGAEGEPMVARIVTVPGS